MPITRSKSLLFFCSLLTVVAFSATASSQTRGFAFLRTTVGARAASMGGAFTAIGQDLHAIAANPAALGTIAARQGTFDYVNSVLDIQSGFGAYLHPTRLGNAALSIFYQDYGNFDRLDEFGNAQGSFSAGSLVFTAAFARNYAKAVWLGAAVKYFRSTIESYSADGLAVDFGVYLDTRLLENLQIGAAVANLGTATTAFINTKEKLPTRFEVGVSKELAHLPLRWSFSIQKYAGDDPILAAGGEFTLSDNLLARLGYNSLGKDQKVGTSQDRFAGIAAGLGIKYQKYLIDYAYSSQGVSGGLNRFSFTVAF